MSRTLAALAALTLAAGAARAADEVDPKTQAAIQAATQAAVDKAVAKAEERLRADVQTSQATRELDAAVAPGPRLEFLELDGYLRARGDYYKNLDLDSGADAAGRYLFPSLRGADAPETLAGANMRLRIEPTLNVSEQVRVRAQIDLLDNYAFGSSDGASFDLPGSPFPVPLYGSSRAFVDEEVSHVDRAPILVKRAWGEVQTPVGLLSFGRMPAGWGLGILSNAGAGIDDDYGDTVDRIQFALPPVTTPVGPLTVVPSLDFDSEGAQYFDPLGGRSIDVADTDDGRSWGLKLARLETEDERRRKLDKGEASFEYGAFYQYKEQVSSYPTWVEAGADAIDGSQVPVKRNAIASVLDLWTRWQKGAWKAELEAAGIYGHVGNANSAVVAAAPTEELLLRQFGLVVTADWAFMPNKLAFGGEVGVASGDDAPGFGNRPDLPSAPYGSLDGQQWGPGDRTIRNFRFNPAYRADVILFRQILGGVTDAWYVKPKVHWDVMPGIAFDGAIIYSSALLGESTPSSTGEGTGTTSLGIEGDAKLTYTSSDGFQAWFEYGLLQPLDGLKTDPDLSLGRAHAIHVGLAARF